MKNSYVAFRRILSLCVVFFFVVASYAQVTLKGVIKDSKGEPIIGASILQKGTGNGTISDFDGNFQLKVPIPSILNISYVGYKTQEISVTNSDFLTVILKDDAELLNEVVVVGYGTVKKNDATGSVTAIKPDEMNKGLVTNAQDMMAGKIAGVSVISDGGTPGGSSTIRIRGGSSLSASNDPLIVIDGLAMDNNGIEGVANPLSMVNPNDIESITVLKDASATAIYGSRASNGVIIITTKKGKSGSKPHFSYEGNASMSSLVNRLDVFNADLLRAYAYSLFPSGSPSNDKKLATLGSANTDWQDQIYRQALSTDHNFSVTGGLKNMPYRISLGYTNQNGIIKTSNMQRVTGSVNVSPSFLDDHLTFNVNTKGMYITNRYASGGVVGAALSMDPTQEIYDKSDLGLEQYGGYYQSHAPANFNDPVWTKTVNQQTTGNPLATLMAENNSAKSKSFVGNIETTYKVHGFEDLLFHANLGVDYSSGRQDDIIQPWSYSNHYYGYSGYTEKYKVNESFNTYAQYAKDFVDKDHFDVMVGYEYQKFYNDSQSEGSGTYQSTNNDASLADTPYNYFFHPWMSFYTENLLVSFFGRANYSYQDKLLLTATMRADGSSRFAPKHRWGYFPSFALAWKLNKEEFMRDLSWLSTCKLRLGYGKTGQQDLNQGDYLYLPTYTVSQEHVYGTLGEIVDGQYVYVISYRPNAYNPDLTWEKTTTYNVGLDYGFLDGRFAGAIDYYYRNTTDLINQVDVPAGTNFKNRVVSNVGSLYNTGVELSLDASVLTQKNLKWDLGFTLTHNINRITELTTGQGSDYYIATGGISSGKGNDIQAHKVGAAANSFYVYETKKDANGNYYFVDRNGDGSINADDRYIDHSPAADALMGFTSKFIYKNLDFSFSLRASIGNYVYNDVLSSNLQYIEKNKIYEPKKNGFQNVLTEAYKTYYADGFKSDNSNFNGEWYMSDYFVENASFLRCDNVTVGYSFKKDNIKGRIYGTVQNPFVITGYKGLDPELSSGIDNNIYPRSMTTIIGLSLQF